MAEDEVPQGVIVCVRLRPMFVKRPDGTPGREATCQRVVEMEGKAEKGVGCAVTKIYDPADMSAEPRSYAFDRSWWSCDGSTEDPERPGFRIPDGPNSKYVDQDMVWSDIWQIVMKNASKGYNCTVFAYGQSGCGKSYSVVGDSPNWGIIPRTVKALFDVVDGNTDPDVRFHVEIAMVEVYMDEVYDLLEPRKKERQKLNVFNNKGEVFIYDPKDRKNMDKIWRACSNHDKAESFRKMGDANRSIRATGMNPESSRGHTLFILRFRKEVKRGGWVEEFRSKLCLIDLAGSERAHDTGLTGVGLEEGIAINQSSSALGQCLVQLCKGERVNYSDKSTKLSAESSGGNAVTVMIAALSPADINYNDTSSTLRFADNAKKMPVKVKKQSDPTAELIRQLQEENAKLQAQLQSMGSEERREWEEKSAAADKKVSESQKALEDMKANAESSTRVHSVRAKTGVEEEELSVEESEAKVKELEEMKNNSDSRLEESNSEITRSQARIQDLGGPEEAQQEQDELVDLMRNKSTSQVQNASIQEQQKETSAMSMEARSGEIERLQDARDAVRSEILKVKKNGGDDTSSQDECSAKSEEQLVLARQDCEKMSEKAAEVGMGKIFHAAISASQRQDEDSKVQYSQDQSSISQASADQDHAQVKRLEEESVKALAEAEKAAQAARDAAEHASQEKMEQVQAMAAERDEARTEASRSREEGGSYKEDSQEKQEAIAAIIRSEMQSWEDKSKKADESELVLKKSFENMGVSMQDMMAMITQGTGFGGKGASICHFVNLCEDAHDDGLIYMIPPGTTKIKKYEDEDEEVCIKLDGDSIKPIHAILESLESSGVTIHPATEGAVLWVNGNALSMKDKVKSEHGARVISGHDFVFRFVDPKAQKKKREKNPMAATGGFDEKGAPVIIDWQYAMSELSRKNGVDVEEEIRKAREKLNDEMAQREKKLAEEQKLLEEKMVQERDEYEKQIEALKKKGQRSSVQDKEQEQMKAQSILHKFKGKSETQRARAQWVRAAFTAGKDERFESDIRISRQQMADLQPRMVEANRIAEEFGIRYSFHFVDAVDPRSRRATTFDDAGDEAAVAPKRFLSQMKVDNAGKGKAQSWSIQKFNDRFVKMLAFADRPAGQRVTEEDRDIFWDDFEHQLVGTAAIGVTPLSKSDSVREYITSRDFSGNITGAVEVSMRMALSSKPSMMRISTAAGSGVLKDQEVVGSLSFGRLSYENAESKNWGSFFVRFSWFDTDGRMEHMSPASQAQDLQYTFDFKQVCTGPFSKFLEEGVMAVQVRAYDKGVAAGESDIVKQKLKLTEDELDRMKKQVEEERSRYQEELEEAQERVTQAKEEAKFEAAKAQAAEAQAAAAQASESATPGPPQTAQPAPEQADGPWQDMRYATLEEVKAELVRARGQVFKIQHDKDDLKEKLQSLQGNTGRARQPADGEFRHTDMEQAHQHILYLETKVRAMEESEKRNETLQRQVKDSQKEKQQQQGGCEIS